MIRAAQIGIAMLLVAGGLTTANVVSATAAAACTSGVPGDVNGDGYAEVAVSENRGARNAGGVHVFYGHRSGLAVKAAGSAKDDQFFDQSSRGVPGTSEQDDGFGWATTFGDFNADGCADLAVGSPGEDDSRGAVVVLYGSRSGITTAGAQSVRFAEVFPPPESLFNRFGSSLAVGDLNDDGVDDLAVGAPFRQLAGQVNAGGVAVLYGNTAGLNRGSTTPVVIDQETPGIPGSAGFFFFFFGSSLAIGDFDGNGRAELAIGAPGTASPGEDDGRGAVHTVEINNGGLVAGAPIIAETVGLDTPGEGEDIGQALAAGDVNNDGLDDLVVGVPGYGLFEREFTGAGAVVLLPGAPIGLTAAGRQLWWQDSPGVVGVSDWINDGFGSALAIGPLDNDAYPDLAIGTPGDTVTSDSYEGSVTVLRGSASGLTTVGFGGARYAQATAGIAGSTESDDIFGESVAIAFVQSRSQGSLIIGAPGETVRGVRRTGQFHQLGINAAGPSPKTSRTFHLDTPGLKGNPSRSASFGREVS
jgi:hypothetical protein